MSGGRVTGAGAAGPRAEVPRVLAGGLRLCLGTLTVVPVRGPAVVDRPVAATAMAMSPVAGVLVGLAVAAAGAVASLGAAPGLVQGACCVLAGALATRFLHVDGLADTADGWAAAAHGERDRALGVMRTGDVGPVGVTVLVLVLLVQVAAAGAALDRPTVGVWTLVWAWALSRAAVPLLCIRGLFRPARPEGLGSAVVGTVPALAAIAMAAASAAAGLLLDPRHALLGVAGLTVTVVAASVLQRRLGGLTGDVLGAGVEVSLALTLVGVVAAG